MTHNIYDDDLRDGLKKEAEKISSQILQAIKQGRKTLVDGSQVPPGMKLVRDDEEEAKLVAIEVRCHHAIPNIELCPSCWFKHGTEAEIVPAGHGTAMVEHYRCAAHCGWSAAIEMK